MFDSEQFTDDPSYPPLVRCRDVRRGCSETYYSGDYPEEYMLSRGDLLIAMDGEFGIGSWKCESGLLNQRVCRLIPREDVNGEYLRFVISAALKKLEERTSCDTVRHISTKALRQMELELHERGEQNRIARILTLTERIAESRRRELQALEELAKARFVELFDDPEFNKMEWKTDTLGNLCSVGSSKRIYQNEQSPEGVPFLRISDLVNRMDTGELTCDLYIPEQRFDELLEQKLVPTEGDILLTARGTLGRCYIVQPEDKFYFQDGMISWLSNFSESITALYISHLFEMSGFRKQIDGLQAGSTVAYLSISMTKKLVVMLPPMGLQEQFADFVKQVDKSKFEVQEALSGIQMLHESLMRDYI